ncbi:MAG: hypothetical protein ACI9TV_000071 [Sulfurimonas sp.]|jgi:hypothetical protein|uniref:LPP20 family lipoprotein n=1 Tax=Sulfurimonas sp. TaxID=2022749 RepID=UPI0039E4AC5C
MIKTLLSITVTAFAVLSFTGCSEEPPKPPTEAEVIAASVNEFGCKQEGVSAPKWTCIPIVADYYAGVGIAPKSAAGMGHMRRVALANGRSDLAQQIQSQVKDKVETYTGTTGNGEHETVDMVTTAVSKQLAKVDLQGSKGIDTWDAPSGTLYMLVTVPASGVNQEVKNAVRTSFKSDNALWQQFKSKQALDSLDAEFPTE